MVDEGNPRASRENIEWRYGVLKRLTERLAGEVDLCQASKEQLDPSYKSAAMLARGPRQVAPWRHRLGHRRAREWL